jgi:membrane-associated phospholipid phosphatase
MAGVASTGSTMTETGRSRATAAGMLALAVLCVVGFIAVAELFLRTTWGQQTDNASLAGSVLGRTRIIGGVQHVLDLVSVSALALATVVIAAIGLIRRRPSLALLSVLVLIGTNFSTRLLKHYLLHRPDLGVDGPDGFHGNTLPSGHTTVAMSVSVALLFVVPPATQWLVALLGGAASAAMGIATLSAGWHRPSDAIAAYLVVGAWAAGLAAITSGYARRAPRRRRTPAVTGSLSVLIAVGALALVVGAIGFVGAGGQAAGNGRHHLFAAYAGGAASVGGTALLVMAALLAIADTLTRSGPDSAVDQSPTTRPGPGTPPGPSAETLRMATTDYRTGPR